MVMLYDHSSGIFGSDKWQKRYFVLNGNRLFYFKKYGVSKVVFHVLKYVLYYTVVRVRIMVDTTSVYYHDSLRLFLSKICKMYYLSV